MPNSLAKRNSEWANRHSMQQRSRKRSSRTLQVTKPPYILKTNTVHKSSRQLCGKSLIRAVLYRTHYLEYLSLLVRKNNIDPIKILSTDDLETVVRRAAKTPPTSFGIPRLIYRKSLLQVLEMKDACP